MRPFDSRQCHSGDFSCLSIVPIKERERQNLTPNRVHSPPGPENRRVSQWQNGQTGTRDPLASGLRLRGPARFGLLRRVTMFHVEHSSRAMFHVEHSSRAMFHVEHSSARDVPRGTSLPPRPGVSVSRRPGVPVSSASPRHFDVPRGTSGQPDPNHNG
jgi:hypothetical protein